MAQQRTSEHETTHTNGLAKDTNFAQTTAKAMKGHPVLQGYALIAGGLAVLFFALGLLPALKWAMVAVGAIITLWGIGRSDLIERIAQFMNRFKK